MFYLKSTDIDSAVFGNVLAAFVEAFVWQEPLESSALQRRDFEHVSLKHCLRLIKVASMLTDLKGTKEEAQINPPWSTVPIASYYPIISYCLFADICRLRIPVYW